MSRNKYPEEIGARYAIYNRLFSAFGVAQLIGQEIIGTVIRCSKMVRHPHQLEEA